MRSLSLLLILTAAACSPESMYRRAALVPTPTPAMLSQTQDRVAELSGSVAQVDTSKDLFPKYGDPALHATHTVFVGQARLRLGPYFRIGGQGFYSNAALATATAAGTPPMDGESVWGVGPNVGFQIRRRNWAFGTGLSLNLAPIPWTVWRRRDASHEAASTVDTRISDYEEVDSGREFHPLVAFGIGPTWIINPAFEAFAGLSLQNSLTNIGFDDEPRDGSTIEARDLGVVPFFGATARIPNGLFLSGQYYRPIGFDVLRADRDLTDNPNWGGIMGTVGIEIGDALEPNDPS